MPDQAPLTTNEKISRLRQKFLDQLPSRMELIIGLWERLRSKPDDIETLTELHRAVHSLKGTGRSFGLKELGDASETCETLMSNRLSSPETPPADDWCRESEECIMLIRNIIGAFQNPPEKTSEDQFLLDLDLLKPYWTPPECRGKLVYLCDDEPLASEQIASQLSCFGYQTVVFNSLEGLRSSMLENRPDALIMDINFPEGRYAGTELAETLRKEMNNGIPVIFLSSLDDFDARLAAVLAGGSSYFTKPPNIQELVGALDTETCQCKPEPYRILIVEDRKSVV